MPVLKRNYFFQPELHYSRGLINNLKCLFYSEDSYSTNYAGFVVIFKYAYLLHHELWTPLVVTHAAGCDHLTQYSLAKSNKGLPPRGLLLLTLHNFPYRQSKPGRAQTRTPA